MSLPSEEYDDDDLGGTGNSIDGEETFAEDNQSGGDADLKFDQTVGALEEMLLDESFLKTQQDYFSAHCQQFEATDENKLIYTTIFNDYVSLMESFIDKYLSSRVDKFDMAEFLEECEQRGEEQLCGDAFDVLSSMSEFDAFKEMILAHKNSANWTIAENTSTATTTASSSSSSSSTAAASAAKTSDAAKPTS